MVSVENLDYRFEAGVLEGDGLYLPYIGVVPIAGDLCESPVSTEVSTLLLPAIFGDVHNVDVLGMTHAAAVATGKPAKFCMWPGSGAPLPEDKGQVKDMMRFGTASLGAAVHNLIASKVTIAPRHTLTAHSLGVVRSLAFAAEAKENVPARVIGLDSAAIGGDETVKGLRGYFSHNSQAKKTGGLDTEAVDNFYASTKDIHSRLMKLMEGQAPKSYRGKYVELASVAAAQTIDFSNIFRSTRSVGLPYLEQYFRNAEVLVGGENPDKKVASVDMHFASKTFALGRISVDGLNEVNARLEQKYPHAQLRFSQGKVGDWHDQAKRPVIVRAALRDGIPTTSRLKHMYYSSTK